MRHLPLGEALDALIDHRGQTPGKLGADFTSSGVKVVSAIMIDKGRISLDLARCVSPQIAASWMPQPTRRGDVLLTSEAPVGRVALVDTDEPLVLGQRVFGLRGRSGLLHSKYLFYFLQTRPAQSQLDGHSTGTTVQGIRQSALRQVLLPLPAYRTQVAIAEVLGALDDKIAAMERETVVADELVRASFDLLIEHASEEAEIGEIAVQVRSQVNPESVVTTTPYVGLEHLPRRRMWLTGGVGQASDVSSAKATYERGDVLFGKLRPNFHKVVAAPGDGICSTDILVLRSRSFELGGYLLAAAASDATVAACVASSEGTRMPRAHWRDLAAVKTPWPGDAEAVKFSALVAELTSKCLANSREIEMLSRLRDALLPELMSGRIRVKDAEDAVSELI